MPASAVKLLCSDTGVALFELDPQQLPALLGRSIQAVVRLEDRWVSRRHCEIFEQAGMLVVRDLGSRHGTYINGTRIEEAQLNAGDILSLGLWSFDIVCSLATT